MTGPWIPPPPEFPDITPSSGMDAILLKWEPSLGAATSLLDVLPQAAPAAGDFNGDGFSDLFVPSTQYTDDELNDFRKPAGRLFLNDGNEILIFKWVDVTSVSGLDVRGHVYAASWTDFDNDGWLDLFAGGYRMAKLYRNSGQSTFADVTADAGLPQDGFSLGAAWGDYDADGRLDLLLSEFGDYTHPDDGLPDLHDVPGKSNRLLRNNGDGTFTDVSAVAGLTAVARRSTGGGFLDVDGDGRLDLFLTNFGEANEYWKNNGDGTFTERAAAVGLADATDAICHSWEDVDKDGRVDLYVGRQGGVAHGIFLAQADGTFTESSSLLAATASGRPWGCGLFDYDNDADMDLLIARGEWQDPMAQQNQLMANQLYPDGVLGFVDNTTEAGERDIKTWQAFADTIATPRATSGLALFDYDLDAEGTPDVITSTHSGLDRVRVFKNVGWGDGWGGGNGDWFRVYLRGNQSNHPGLGAVVTVTAGNVSTTRHVGAGMLHGSQSITDVVFGLLKPEEGGYKGVARPVSVTIRWPSGLVDTYNNFWIVDSAAVFTEGVGFKNDTLAPRPGLKVIAGTAGQNSWFVTQTVTLRLTAQDLLQGGSLGTGVKSLRFSRDGTAWTSVANPAPPFGVQITFTGDGTHKLWVETEDFAGNRAVILYPIRIDTTPPGGHVVSPAIGKVYAQGREIAEAPPALNRSLVVAPVPAGFADLGTAGAPLEAAAGSDGSQRVRADAQDGQSGVARVWYRLERANGAVLPGHESPTLDLSPYDWRWMANRTALGEYRLYTNVTDHAGHTAEFWHRVEVVPTTPDGLASTVNQGPSVPPLLPPNV